MVSAPASCLSRSTGRRAAPRSAGSAWACGRTQPRPASRSSNAHAALAVYGALALYYWPRAWPENEGHGPNGADATGQ
jgi:hypothetical protein